MDELDDLLGEYFDCGVAEGREGRNHDTEDGRAQKALSAIRDRVKALIAEEREACAKVCDALAHEWRGANSRIIECADKIRARLTS